MQEWRVDGAFNDDNFGFQQSGFLSNHRIVVLNFRMVTPPSSTKQIYPKHERKTIFCLFNLYLAAMPDTDRAGSCFKRQPLQ